MKKTKSLTEIQDEYINTVTSGLRRWAHRKDGGHIRRIRGGAYKKAYREFEKWGCFTPDQIKVAISEAQDMVTLEMNATCDE